MKKERFELSEPKGELRYTGINDLILTEEDLKRVNLILPEGLHIIGICGECKFYDEPDYTCINELSDRYGEPCKDGCIHFEAKEVANEI